MSYAIEKSIPIPDRTAQEPGRYPFAQMEVGDSFVVPRSERHRVDNAAAWYRKRRGHRYTRRTLGDTVRIWRVQ
jgi:hypothetical protein